MPGKDEAKMIKLTHQEAEVAKLAHNAYIATKVSFTNEVERISEDLGVNPENVMRVIWADRRVRSKEHLKNLGIQLPNLLELKMMKLFLLLVEQNLIILC